MAQSFDGLTLSNPKSIVNYGATRPPSVLNIPTQIINSNARDTPIKIKDGKNSVRFGAVYQILTGGISEYNAIKAKESVTGILVDGSDTWENVTLLSVGLAQNLGSGALRCQLSFEFLG